MWEFAWLRARSWFQNSLQRHNQNQADLDSLILRLDRLSRELCNASPSSDPAEQSRRDFFVRYSRYRCMLGFTWHRVALRMLQNTSARVTTLRERCLASTSVTQAIAGCFVEIDRYLAEYLVVFYSLTNVCIYSPFCLVSGRPKCKVSVTYAKCW
jgi:hypothetical protein